MQQKSSEFNQVPDHQSQNSNKQEPQQAENHEIEQIICYKKLLILPKDEEYEFIKRKDEGTSCGEGYSALNKKTRQKVIISKVPFANDSLNNGKKVIKEIKLLKSLNHDNIITLQNIIQPYEPTGNEDIFMVFEFMETHLQKVIYSKVTITNDHVKYFLYQILRGLLYIHSTKVIHRGIKPSNILINSNCDLKISNFHSAIGLEEDENIEFDAITYWYIAPEEILDNEKVKQAVDIWCVGCVAAELLGRRPIFQGNNSMDLIKKIIQILGTPILEDMMFSQKAFDYIKSLPKTTKQSWQNIFPEADPQALDLLSKMLVFNPDKRYTAKQCLQHPYFEELHFPEEEPESDQPFDWDWYKFEPTKEILQKMINKEQISFLRH